MKVTEKWLNEESACETGINWFLAQKEKEGIMVVKKLIAVKKFDWANWLVCRLLLKKDKVRYAIYAAEQVIEFFDKKYPQDKRPRGAIEAAKAYLKNPNEKNKAYAAKAKKKMRIKILQYGFKLRGACKVVEQKPLVSGL